MIYPTMSKITKVFDKTLSDLEKLVQVEEMAQEEYKTVISKQQEKLTSSVSTCKEANTFAKNLGKLLGKTS